MRKVQIITALLVAGVAAQAAYGTWDGAVEGSRINTSIASPRRVGASPLDWDLRLPDRPVARRVCGYYKKVERTVLADIKGPGCIRHMHIAGSNIGRDVVLRIYFDGEPVPYVEAPLGDFFGAMHNLMAGPKHFAAPEEAYTLNTPFLVLQPHSAKTAYFAMPFAKSARMEVQGSHERPSDLYYWINWHEYPGQKLEEPMRFAARWRREAPVRDWADEFIMLDAEGPGRLIGFVYSVDMLQDLRTHRWSHAGAENIYIDGDGEHPAYIRGYGGEDTFGTSYGGHIYPAQSALFADMPYYIQKDSEYPIASNHSQVGLKQKLVGYRFFLHDAIFFERSLHMRFASRNHDVAATVYWYTAKPVRPYFEMPVPEKRLPGSEVRRGEYDLPLPESGRWWIAGPFSPGRFRHPLPAGSEFDSTKPFHDKPWQKFAAIHGFVDFNHVYRPPASVANALTLDAVAVARAILVSPSDTQATLTLGWDDQLVIQVNDGEPIDLGDQAIFRGNRIEVPLLKGENAIALWLSNTRGKMVGSWAFSLRAVTAEGEVLLPLTDPAHPTTR